MLCIICVYSKQIDEQNGSNSRCSDGMKWDCVDLCTVNKVYECNVTESFCILAGLWEWIWILN